MIISLGCWSPNTSCNLPGDFGRAALKHLPIWSCSGWGLPCPSCHHEGGELLPRLFTLACITGGLFSVALSPGRPTFALRTTLPYRVRTFLSGRDRSDHAPTPKVLQLMFLEICCVACLFGFFQNRCHVIHETLTCRTVKHLVTFEQHVVFLGRNRHETSLTDTVDYIYHSKAVAA